MSMFDTYPPGICARPGCGWPAAAHTIQNQRGRTIPIHRFEPPAAPAAPTVDSSFVSHLNGIAWWEAPIPRRWHRCWGQTLARIDGHSVRRCPCGAIKVMGFGRPTWDERNSARKSRRGPIAPPPTISAPTPLGTPPADFDG